MKCLVFDIEGKFAHFRKTYTNSSSMSYMVPPRTTIIGLIAGLLGREKDSYYEEFKSHNIDIAVKVESKIYSIMQTLNYIKATSPKGIFHPKEYTQIPFEALTSDDLVKYRIYVYTEDKELFDEIENMLEKEEYVYPPYLGVAFFTGQIDYIGKANVRAVDDRSYVDISSVLAMDDIEDMDVTSVEDIIMVKELMPTNFKENRRICKSTSYLVVSEPRAISVKLSCPYFKVNYGDRDENILFM